MCRIINENFKKGQNVSISSNHGNKSYNILANMGKYHFLSQLSPNSKARIQGASIRNVH